VVPQQITINRTRVDATRYFCLR